MNSQECLAKWYKREARKGIPLALMYVSYFYSEGLGVARDLEKSQTFAIRAGQAMDQLARAELGARYASFAGLYHEPALALEWYQELAEEGLVEAQTICGILYMRGYWVEKDFGRAESDPSTAQNSLGILYLQGDGVEQDPGEAARWFRMAAVQENAKAQMNMWGLFYVKAVEPLGPEEYGTFLMKAAERGLCTAQMTLAGFDQEAFMEAVRVRT